MIAQHCGLCPICGMYIAKSRSRIAKLPRKIPVQVDLWPASRQCGWYPSHGVYDPELDTKLRDWVHERCYRVGADIASGSS